METLRRVAVVLLAGGFLGGVAGTLAGRRALSGLMGVGTTTFDPAYARVAEALRLYELTLLGSSAAGALLAGVAYGWLWWRRRAAAAGRGGAAAGASPPAPGA
ncbi:MAG: hypothetical protein RL653_2737 [Pseudomonadota bacterium]